MADTSPIPKQSFAGKVAVVTGSSRGIGRATALALGRAGANIVVNYRAHADEAEEVVHAIREAGGGAIAQRADVANQQEVEQLVERAVEEFGRLDIAVSNAAYSAREPFHEADMEEFRRTIDVTMWGAFYLLRAAARAMIRRDDKGVIVIVSSPLSFLAIPTSMPYNMSKAAIEQMAKTAAIELAEKRIRVNVIQPGWIDTPGERKFSTEEDIKAGGKKIPLGRLGTPEEIAEGILLLAHPSHTYMTGSTLLLDGGFCLPWWFKG